MHTSIRVSVALVSEHLSEGTENKLYYRRKPGYHSPILLWYVVKNIL